MSTLFQLHSDLTSLSNTRKLPKQYQQGDAIILLGTTLAFVDAIINIIVANKSYNKENQQAFRPKLYALQEDFNNLNTTAQEKLTDKLANIELVIELIDDEQWVALVETFDNVVMINH